MELDSATMTVSLIGSELGSRHREQYCTIEKLCYEEEIGNAARQQALVFMYLPYRREISRLRGPRYVTANLPKLGQTNTMSKAAFGQDYIYN